MQMLLSSLLIKSHTKPLNVAVVMPPKEKIFVFDLDDTLVQTTKYDPEYWNRDFSNLKLFGNMNVVLNKIGKDKCLLLTYDKHGLQDEKIERLTLRNRFKEIYIVKEVEGKLRVLSELKQRYPEKDIVVVGDRHEDGELQYGKKLGLTTVCVALEGCHHYDSTRHGEYDVLVEKEDDFLKIIDLI